MNKLTIPLELEEARSELALFKLIEVIDDVECWVDLNYLTSACFLSSQIFTIPSPNPPMMKSFYLLKLIEFTGIF